MRRRSVAAVAAITTALLFCAPATARDPTGSPSIKLRDGVQLAADLFVADGTPQKRPTVLLFSRYGRPGEENGPWIDAMAGAGLNALFVDIRGAGASFGVRRTEFSATEIADIDDVLNWIRTQDWSNGDVAVTGNSYAADASEWAVSRNHPALKAAVIRHAEFDVYRHLTHPGGVRNEFLLRAWGAAVADLDRSEACLGSAARCAASDNLRPVDGDQNFDRLRAALRQHRANARPDRQMARIEFTDDVVLPGITYGALSVASASAQLRVAKTPVQYWGSWLDAGTAETALERFVFMPDTPMELFLAPWAHGGSRSIDPFAGAAQPNVMERPAQIARWNGFIRAVLVEHVPPVRTINYWPLGADAWRQSEVWPPAGVQTTRWHLHGGGQLRPVPPSDAGSYRYRVDYAASTGKDNRWHTQVASVRVAADRAAADKNLLVFETSSFDQAQELAGSAIARLTLAADREDGAVFVYLEDVAPDGRVTYLSEGMLRLAARMQTPGAAPTLSGIRRSFARKDARTLQPGKREQVEIPLFVTAAKIAAGHRLRFAIAGADADTFARYPAQGRLTFDIAYGAAEGTTFFVPMRPWQSQEDGAEKK